MKKISFVLIFLICFTVFFIFTKSSTKINAASTWETVVNSQFNSMNELEKEWNNFYPWGTSHNGSAYMTTSSNIFYIQNGVLYLKATKRSDGKYNAGAIHAKHIVKITNDNPDYTLEIRAKVPYNKGTWPAFWLTHTGSWIAEMDVMEFKGSNTNWQNTYDKGNWQTVKTSVSNPSDWHTYKVYFNKVSDTAVNVHYYVDGKWKAQHRANFVNKPFWVIANLQMEGSSGSPGPNEATYAIDYIKIDRTKNNNIPNTTTPPTSTPVKTSTPKSSLTANYSISNDWGNGASINVVVKNNGTSSIDNWTVTWTFSGNQKISSLWNGKFTQNGSNVTVTNLNWNGNIKPNNSTSFGCNISYSGTNNVPNNISVK